MIWSRNRELNVLDGDLAVLGFGFSSVCLFAGKQLFVALLDWWIIRHRTGLGPLYAFVMNTLNLLIELKRQLIDLDGIIS